MGTRLSRFVPSIKVWCNFCNTAGIVEAREVLAGPHTHGGQEIYARCTLNRDHQVTVEYDKPEGWQTIPVSGDRWEARWLGEPEVVLQSVLCQCAYPIPAWPSKGQPEECAKCQKPLRPREDPGLQDLGCGFTEAMIGGIARHDAFLILLGNRAPTRTLLTKAQALEVARTIGDKFCLHCGVEWPDKFHNHPPNGCRTQKVGGS